MPFSNKIFSLIPRNPKIYNFCKGYIDKYNGDNNDNIHTNGELRFMKRNLGKCNVIFDIGAHFGHWTKLALKINRNLNIHCFEPSSYSFKKLINNNFPNNVICNNFGLSSSKGEKTLYIFENGSGLNSLYLRYGLEKVLGRKIKQREEKIKVETLENYCLERKIEKIDFVKIDVEGHELEVLKGGINFFKNKQIRIIQFEYGGCNIDAHIFLMDIFNFFKGMDYNFYKIYPDHIKFIKRYETRFDNFQYQNWLIIKKNYKYIP
ncbi:MAG: FkbM family methyltransferase [Candidatus Hodarchaeota archaeon]